MASNLVVKRKAAEVITPSSPTPHELKLLSDIDDQQSLRFHAPIICFYKHHPSMAGIYPAVVIREALAKSLVYYYPLAGRLQEAPNGKLVVNCRGQGVLFTEADAFVTLDQLGDSIMTPYLCLDEILYNVPGSDGILGCPLMLIQVTRFVCGGFVLAFRLNHAIIDAVGFTYFMNTMAELANGATAPSQMPTWQRDMLSLNARNPPRITCVHHEYDDVPNLGNVDYFIDQSDQIVNQSVFISNSDIKNLRQRLSPNLRNKATKFELIAACLWRSRTAALNLHPDQVVRLSIAVSLRSLNESSFHIPHGYYGNTFVFPAAATKARLLCNNALEYAVSLIKQAKGQVNEEYIRSVADLMVLKGRPRFTSTAYFIISDNTKAGYDEVDFGWRKAIFAGPATCLSIISFVSKYKRKGEDGFTVPVCLPKSTVARFQTEVNKLVMSCPTDSSML